MLVNPGKQISEYLWMECRNRHFVHRKYIDYEFVDDLWFKTKVNLEEGLLIGLEYKLREPGGLT